MHHGHAKALIVDHGPLPDRRPLTTTATTTTHPHTSAPARRQPLAQHLPAPAPRTHTYPRGDTTITSLTRPQATTTTSHHHLSRDTYTAPAAAGAHGRADRSLA